MTRREFSLLFFVSLILPAWFPHGVGGLAANVLTDTSGNAITDTSGNNLTST